MRGRQSAKPVEMPNYCMVAFLGIWGQTETKEMILETREVCAAWGKCLSANVPSQSSSHLDVISFLNGGGLTPQILGLSFMAESK